MESIFHGHRDDERFFENQSARLKLYDFGHDLLAFAERIFRRIVDPHRDHSVAVKSAGADLDRGFSVGTFDRSALLGFDLFRDLLFKTRFFLFLAAA